MSVQSYLDSLGSRLILSSDENSSIQTSILSLSSRLSSYFDNIEKKLIFGSYDRDVILPRIVDENSDIDYMVIFKDASSYSTQTCLNWLKKFAEEKYSRSEIFQSSPTIVLELSHIKFELVPAYSGPWSLYIPAPSSSLQNWITTDPPKMKEDLINKNTQNSYKIKPLVRIMKYWNVLNGKIYSSYELEKMIVDKFYFLDSSIKDYFYDFVLALNSYNLPQYKKDKVDRLKRNIQEVKNNEERYPYLAEKDLKVEFPDF